MDEISLTSEFISLTLMADTSLWTGQYECVCGGFTTGKFCQECLPMYNQIGYLYGRPCEGKQISSDLFHIILGMLPNNDIGYLFQNATATTTLKAVGTTLPLTTWTKALTLTDNGEEVASVLTVRTTQEVPVETTNMSKFVTKLRIYRSLSEYRVHIESCYFLVAL